LSIEYLFKEEMHRAEVGDTQAVVAPLRGELYHLSLSFALHFCIRRSFYFDSIKWEGCAIRGFALANLEFLFQYLKFSPLFAVS